MLIDSRSLLKLGQVGKAELASFYNRPQLAIPQGSL
jgi:hypothetical protein